MQERMATRWKKLKRDSLKSKKKDRLAPKSNSMDITVN